MRPLRSRATAAALVVAAACSAGCGESAADGVDAGVDADGACSVPEDEPAWLAAFLDDAVARLAGAEELSPGVTLADRATPARRAQTRAWLADQLTALGYAPELDDYGSGINVWAALPPTQLSTTWVVVGAHLDSFPGSPGANDNATGIAVTLAVARQLRSLGCRARGVQIAFFDQEEVGLVGATAYARRLFLANTDVVAVHTIDQVGWDSDGDRTYELEQPSPALEVAYRSAAAAIGVPVVTTPTGGSDHEAFRERGFEAIGVTEEYVSGDTTPFRHQAADTYATVDQAYLLDAARLVTGAVVAQVAGSE